MIQILGAILIVLSAFVVPPQVAAQSCGGGSMTFARKERACTIYNVTANQKTATSCDPANFTPPTTPYVSYRCDCVDSCPASQLKEFCADYNTSQSACSSLTNLDRSIFPCGSGQCVWNPPAGGGGVPPPPGGGVPPPQPPPPVTDKMCPGGVTCGGVNVTGVSGQVVCGQGGLSYTCNGGTGSWDYNGNQCTEGCVGGNPPPVSCTGGILCSGAAVDGIDGQIVCGQKDVAGNAHQFRCAAGTWTDTGSYCTDTCPVVPPPPTTCPSITKCDGTSVTGSQGLTICEASSKYYYTCDSGAWVNSFTPCTDGCPVAPPPVSQTCGNASIEGTEQCDSGSGGAIDPDPTSINGACPNTCSLSCTINSCNIVPPVFGCGAVCASTTDCPTNHTCTSFSGTGRCVLNACLATGAICDSTMCFLLSAPPVPPPPPALGCGGGCTVDAQCPSNHSCSVENGVSKCVLSACLATGALCDANKCVLSTIPPPQQPPVTCGNGTPDYGEECDLGTSASANSDPASINGSCPSLCSSSCKVNTCSGPTLCGNAVVDVNETCDLGTAGGANAINGGNNVCPATCNKACTINACTPPANPPMQPPGQPPLPTVCNEVAAPQSWDTVVLCAKTGVGSCVAITDTSTVTIPQKAAAIKLVASAVASGNLLPEECARVKAGGLVTTVCSANPLLGKPTDSLTVPVSGVTLKIDAEHLIETEFEGGAKSAGAFKVHTDALFCGKASDKYDPSAPAVFENVTVRIRVAAPALSTLANNTVVLARISAASKNKVDVDRTVTLKSQGGGILEGDFATLARISTGNTVYVKLPKHLRIEKTNISIVSGLNVIDLTSTPVPAGDVANNFGVIDANDMAAIRLHAGSVDTKSLAIADVNSDGAINDIDLQITSKWLNFNFAGNYAFQGAKGNQQGTLDDRF